MLSTSTLDVLLAAVPPLAVLILMVGFRWGGGKAGTTGWALALVIAILRFGAVGDVLWWAHIRSVFLTLDVIYIVWMALLLYLVVNQAGALQVIADWFIGLTGDNVLRVLLLGWVFTSFLQGVGGFGVPVAVVAPLLVGLGLSPLQAIIVPSIGHAWAVTFGSLGSSFIALLGVTGLDASYLSPPTAILLGVSAITCGLLAGFAYGGWSGMRRAFPAIILIGLVMAVGQYILATNGLWNIASAGGSLAALVVGLWVARWPRFNRQKPAPVGATDKPSASDRPRPTFALAIAGYATLAVLAVLLTGVIPIKNAVGQVQLSISVPETTTSLGWITPATPDLGLRLLNHTGAVLLYSALIAYILYRQRSYFRPGAERAILKGVVQKGIRPSWGILTMVAMATVMANAGMTRALAVGLSQAVPSSLYAFVAALIGSIGAFMTGSNTNSNAVFGVLQMDTAGLLGLSVSMILATQTAAAAIASLLAPAKIIVGASTVGMSGNEGTVLQALLLYGSLLIVIVAALAFILLGLGY
jgi:lactate permease